MSSLSNKFKLEAKSLEPQVVKFISNTKSTNLHIIPEDSNIYSIIGTSSYSNNEAYIGLSSNGVINKIAAFNDCNINFFRDTIVHGNLIIDGYVMTLGLDVSVSRDELFSSNQTDFTNVGSNVIVQKYIDLIDVRLLSSSNSIISNINVSYSNLYNDAYAILSSNNSFTEAIRLADNYSDVKFNNRFASKTADQILDGSSNDFIINNIYNKLTVKADLIASNFSSLNNINVQNNIIAQKFIGDGTHITNIIAGDGTTNSISEGSNLYFKYSYVGSILNNSNTVTSNYISGLYSNLELSIHSNIANSSNNISNSSNILSITNLNIISNLSNYVSADLTDIQNRAVEHYSNIENVLMYDDGYMSNYVGYIFNVLQVINSTSNQIVNMVSEKHQNLYVYNIQTSNRLLNTLNNTFINIDENLKDISNILYDQSLYNNQGSSNNIISDYGYSNLFESVFKITSNNLKDYQMNSSNYLIIAMVNMNSKIYDTVSKSSDKLLEYNEKIINDLKEYKVTTSNNAYDDLNMSRVNTSNYIRNVSNIVLAYLNVSLNHLNMYNENVSNLTVINSNLIATILNHSNSDIMNSINNTSNMITNYIKVVLNNLNTTISQSIDESSAALMYKINTLNTDDVIEGSSNMYYDDQKFNELFSTLNLDNFANGTSNKFIVNDIYDDDLYVLGTVYTSNLLINGQLNMINTTIYRSGSYLISTSNDVNLQVTHNNLNDIVTMYDKDDNIVMIVKNTGKTGIKRVNPEYELDVNGVAGCYSFIGAGRGITNVNLSDKSSHHLAEGSNLYFTTERVSILIDASNINVSNFVLRCSNNLINSLNVFDTQSNFITDEYDTVKDVINYNSINVSNYLFMTSNAFIYAVEKDTQNLSNYNAKISSMIQFNVGKNIVDNSNYVMMTSNKLIGELANIIMNNSNYVTWTVENIKNSIMSDVINVSNYVSLTSNKILNDIVNSSLDKNQSNYLVTASNVIFERFGNMNQSILNYMNSMSNMIIKDIYMNDVNINNYAVNMSNNVMNFVNTGLVELNASTNIYTITDVYNGDKIIHLNFYDSNIINKNTSTNFKLYDQTAISSINSISNHTFFNNYFEEYDNKFAFNSSNNVYIFNSNDTDIMSVLNGMNAGFVVHFMFKTAYTQNTPIYFIGRSSNYYVNIKILNGNPCIFIGDICVIVLGIILLDTWYMFNVVANVDNGNMIFKVYLNQVLQKLLIKGGSSIPEFLQIADYNNDLNYSGGQNMMMMLGSRNLVDIQDTSFYTSGFVYTNTYYSSNSYKTSNLQPILNMNAYDRQGFSNLIYTSEYEYQYSSNVKNILEAYHDNADIRLNIGNKDINNIDRVLTEVVTNVKLASGYYYFSLDIANEIAADISLKNEFGEYISVANYYTSNVSSLYPFYIPDGYYKFYLKLLRRSENRHDNYLIAKYKYLSNWNDIYYSLNYDENILYEDIERVNQSGAMWLNSTYYTNNNVISANSNVYVYNYNDSIGYSTGNNVSGQLGLGNNTNYTFLQQILGYGASGYILGISKVVSSESFTVILKSDGTVYACGNNDSGQLGVGDNNNYNVIQKVKGIHGNGFILNVIDVAVGVGHTLFLRNDNTAYGVGLNTSGQLGLGNSTNYNTLQVITVDNVIQMAGGLNYSLFLKNNNQVYACGNNDVGQLGLGNYTSFNTIQELLFTDCIQVSSRNLSTYLLKSDGSCYACGLNDYGQLGLGNNTNYNVLQQMKGVNGVGFISNIKQVSAGTLFVLLLDHTGSVYGCGENVAGQLGLGNNSTQNTLKQIQGINGVGNITNIVYIATGLSHSLLLKNDGSVYSCGYNNYGQLGVGNNINYNILQQVKGENGFGVISDVVSMSAGNHSIFIQNKAFSTNVSNYSYDINDSFFGNYKNNTSNLLNIQDFKILNNPLVMGSDFSLSNILYYGKESCNVNITNKLRSNRWQEEAGYDMLANKYVYYREGNVGIGNVIPLSASLEINTSTAVNSIKTNNGIWTNLGIINSSDERIKNNIKDINDDSALKQILSIEPKCYDYINKDKGNVYGFIAQQVRQVIPQAVSIQSDCIPNIYTYCRFVDGVIETDIVLPEYIREGNGIVIVYNNSKYIDTIKSINGGNIAIHNKSGIPYGSLFVYGTIISDYHVLDKSYIYTLNVCALQEIHRQNLRLKEDVYGLTNYDLSPTIDLVSSNMDLLNNDILTLTEKHALTELEVKINELLGYSVSLKNDTQMVLNNIEGFKNIDLDKKILELNQLKEENSRLLTSNQELVKTYNQLNNTIHNYTNEIITIKSILQMNNII
jgi:alpha-tubulin suppressor-like RCC1 family protein